MTIRNRAKPLTKMDVARKKTRKRKSKARKKLRILGISQLNTNRPKFRFINKNRSTFRSRKTMIHSLNDAPAMNSKSKSMIWVNMAPIS